MKRFGDVLMARAFIIKVFDSRQTFAVGITGLGQKLFRFGEVALIIQRIIVIAADIAEFFGRVGVGQACRDISARGHLAGFADILNDPVAVDSQCQRLTNFRVIQRRFFNIE